MKQATIDIEMMFDLLGQNAEIEDVPGAVPLVVEQGRVRFEDVHFTYGGGRPILRGISFDVAPGKTSGDRRPIRRRQVDDLGGCCSASTSRRPAASRSTGRTSRA